MTNEQALEMYQSNQDRLDGLAITDTEILDLAVDHFMKLPAVKIAELVCDDPDMSVRDLALKLFGDQAEGELIAECLYESR